MKRRKQDDKRKIETGLKSEKELEQLHLQHQNYVDKINSDFKSFTQQRASQKELVKDSLKYINDLIDFKNELNDELTNGGDSFFELDNFPNDHKLEGIKNYLNYYKYNIDKYELPYDWQLDCDEKSILTQDRRVLDKTFSNMKKTQQNIGEKYSNQISNIVKMIKMLDKEITQILQTFSLLSSSSLDKRPKTFSEEYSQLNNYKLLLNFKTSLEECLEKYYDTYTYEVLSNPNGNMDSLDTFTWNYKYICPTFSMHMIAFKNIPKSSKRSKNDLILKLEEKNGTIKIPYMPKLEKCAIRRLEYSYDLLSEKSLNYHKPYDRENFSMNILQVLENDEIVLKGIYEKVLLEINEKISYFETIMLERIEKEKKALETAKKNKAKDNQKKVKRRKEENNTIKLNLDFGPLENYDIIEKLNEIRNDEFRNYIHGMRLKLSNETSDLLPGDINIRSHRLLGDIQNIQLVKKPVIKREFILTHQNYTQVFLPRSLKKESVNDELKTIYKRNRENSWISEDNTQVFDKRLEGGGDDEPFLKQKQQHKQQMKNLGNLSNENSNNIQIELEQDYFQFEFILPQNILWWSEPIICYWEPWEESEEFQNLEENVKYFHLNYNEIMDNLQNRLFNTQPINKNKSQITYVQNDFSLDNITKSIDFHFLLKKFIMPNLPYNFITKVEIEYDKLKDFNKKPHLITSIREQRQQLEDTISAKTNHKANRNIFVDEYAKPMFQNFLKFRHALIVKPTTEDDYSDEDDSFSYQDTRKIMFSEFYDEILNVSKSEEPYFKPSSQTIIRPAGINQIPDFETTKLQQQSSLISTKSKRTPKISKTSQLNNNNYANKTVYDTNHPKDNRSNRNYIKKGHNIGRKLELIEHPVGRWCTRGIISQEYDMETKRMRFETNKLGTFGIAAYRYHLLPFLSWTLESHTEMENTVVLSIRTEHIDFQIYVDDKGYYLNFLKKKYFPFNIQKPMNFNDFKAKLRSIGIDIFPSIDASCYVKNNSEKLYPLEYHCYFSMVAFCKYFKFKSSIWNRYGNHREIILLVEQLLQTIEQRLSSMPMKMNEEGTKSGSGEITNGVPVTKMNENTFLEVLVTPFKCEIIKVNEDCSDDLEKVKISYEINEDYTYLSYQADFFSLLTNLYAQNIHRHVIESENKYLEWNLAQLLINMRLFSFS